MRNVQVIAPVLAIASAMFATCTTSVAAPIYAFTTVQVPTVVATRAVAINNAGLIAGYYTTPVGLAMGFSYGGTDHGFVFNPATGIYTLLDDPLAAPAGTTGFMPASGGTDALGINDLGQVVGTYYDYSVPSGRRGFVYDPTSNAYTTLINPAAPDQNLLPSRINDSGQIVGSFTVGETTLGNGFIATPQISTVPEPSSLALLDAFAGCAWIARRELGREVGLSA